MENKSDVLTSADYEKTLLSILNSQPEMICRCSMDTRIIFINNSYADFLGKKATKLQNNLLFDFLSVSQKRKLQDNINYLFKHKKNISYEHRILVGREQTRWQRWTYQPIFNDQHEVIEFQVVGVDISHHKTEQEKSRGASKHLSSLINSHKDAFFLLNKDLKILEFNRSASNYIHQHWDKTLKKGQNLKDFAFPEDLAMFITDFDRSYQGEFIVREKQFNALNGVEYWYEQNFTPVEDDLGNIYAVTLRLTEISKQKAIEKQIKRKRLEQKVILDNIPNLVWLKDQQGKFLSVNQPFANLTNKSKEEIIGKTDFEIWEKNQAQKQIKEDKEILSSGKQKLTEELLKLGENQKWVETFKAPVFDENGVIIGTTGTTSDISIRKKIAQQLEILQQDYNKLIEGLSNTTLLFFDNDLTYTFCEGVDLDLPGFDKNTIVGKKPDHIFPKNIAMSLRKVYEESLKGKTHQEVLSFDDRTYLVSCAPCENTSKKDEGVCTIIDLTRLPVNYQNEVPLPVPAADEFIEESKALIFTLNSNLKIQHINTQVSQVLGYSLKEIIQYSFSEILLPATQGGDIKDLLKNPKETLDQTFYLITQKGNKIPVLIDISKSKSNQYLIFCKEITHLQEKMEKLELSKQKAEEEAALKTQFLSTMSHEIRTPLNAVIAMTHLLLQENPRSNQIKSLNTLKFSAENLLVIINDILDYNKIESGKIDFEMIEFELRELIGSIREELRYKAEDKGIHFIIRMDERIPAVLIGDPVRLSQILNNLIDNAIKFTSKGKVKLEIDIKETEDPNIKQLDFVVSDTGIGINQEKIQSIFERFTQASADTTRKFGGTGLGLAITKKLIELQGGEIRVDSQPGAGSKFYFSINFQRSHKTSLPTYINKQDKTPQNLNGAKVLMVEDNEMNQLVASQFLHKWNAQIDYADNGEIAISMVQQKNYDIVLMDLEMPVMDGYQTTKIIRKLGGAYKYLPIIALTASAMSEVKDLVIEAGMNDYVAKPFAPQDLYNKLSKNLHIKKVNMEIFEQAENNQISNPMGLSSENQINFKKIVEISGGNKAFIRKYKELSEKIFKEFPINYKEALTEQDYEKLRKMSHNIRATIGILDLYALDVEIQNGRRLLKEDKPDNQELKTSIGIVEKLCTFYLKSLESFA